MRRSSQENRERIVDSSGSVLYQTPQRLSEASRVFNAVDEYQNSAQNLQESSRSIYYNQSNKTANETALFRSQQQQQTNPALQYQQRKMKP